MTGYCYKADWLKAAAIYDAGNVGDMLYGASLMPNLQILDASDQALTGQLSAVQIPTLEVLNLSNNSIQVYLPPLYPPCSTVMQTIAAARRNPLWVLDITD